MLAFFVHASYDHRTGQGTLRVGSDIDGRVTVPALDIDVGTGQAVTVAVRPWTARRAGTPPTSPSGFGISASCILLWRTYGLHRMRHRPGGVESGDDALTVRTRVAPAAGEVGLRNP